MCLKHAYLLEIINIASIFPKKSINEMIFN